MSLTCMEWWSYEVCILISGILSTLDAATFVACFTLINVLYMVSLGFAISASVRVGQFLGADEPNNAKRTGKVAVILIALWGILECLVLFLARNQIGRIFSNDRDVIDLIGKSLKIVCVVVFFDDLQTVVGGIYRGSGRQATGACIAFVSYYVLALPIGIPLALLTTLNVVGFWVGILCGVVFQFVAGIFVVLCSDWKLLAKKARARMEKAEANGEARGSSVEPSNDINSDVTELLTSDESIEEATEERLQPEVSRKGLRPKDFRAKVIRLIILYSIGLAVLTSAGIASQYKPTNGNDNCSSNKSENVMSNLTSCVNTSLSSSIVMPSTLAFTLKPSPTVKPRIQISAATIPPSSSSIKATISS
ncbi:multidrug and toxin extrusion protein 1-like isoform X2 [Oscarella lobularis]